MKQWSAIERSLFADHKIQLTLNSVDAFLDSIEAFHYSEMYRIFRLMSDGAAYSPENVTGMVLAFRESVIMEDGEKAARLSVEINETLIQWLALDAPVARSSAASYLSLGAVFVFFVALLAVAVMIMSRALARSLNREAEGSVFHAPYSSRRMRNGNGSAANCMTL